MVNVELLQAVLFSAHAAVVGFQADLNCNVQEETGAFYGVTSQYESPENMTITCSTKVCSFGKQVVEKVEVGFTGAFPLMALFFKRSLNFLGATSHKIFS